MTPDRCEALGGRRGHFVYESGHHGDLWLDLDLMLLAPANIEGWARELTAMVADCAPDVVCGPLTGGAFVAQRVAAFLGADFVFAERDVRAGAVQYRIPRTLHHSIAQRRVLLVDDVINAGSATRATLAALEEIGAAIAGIASLATSGEAAEKLAATRGVALYRLQTLERGMWHAGECPLCAAGVPIDEPR